MIVVCECVLYHIQKITLLSFVPIPFLRVAWNAILAEILQHSCLHQYTVCSDATWINGNYRPLIWNYSIYAGPHTHNHLEGWNNRLN